MLRLVVIVLLLVLLLGSRNDLGLSSRQERFLIGMLLLLLDDRAVSIWRILTIVGFGFVGLLIGL